MPMGSLSGIDELSHSKYPVIRRDESVVDNYHGTLVPDPYRWLEDPDSDETREFVEAQVKLTESVLKTCDVARDKIRATMAEMFDHPRYSAPFKRGNKYFYFHNSGLQPQDVFFCIQDEDSIVDGKAEAEVLLDPNKLSDDGTVSLTACAVSENGKYLAYGLSKSGSDWVTIEVMRIEDRRKEEDVLLWVKFSTIAWTSDSRGFFYSRYAAPSEGEEWNQGIETNAHVNHKLYYHFLGTHQSKDILCWQDPDNPLHRFTSSVTEDGKYVILQARESCKEANKVYYLDLSALPNGGLQGSRIKQQPHVLLPFTKLVDNFDASYFYVANDGTSFTFLTNKDAPRYKLIRVHGGVGESLDEDLIEDIIPESETDDVLTSAVAVDEDKLLVCYLSHVRYVVQVRDLNNGSLLHVLPVDIGTVYKMSARRKDSITFFGFTSFLSPGIIYQCDFRNSGKVPKLKIFREIYVQKFDRNQFNVSQVFVPSKDGTCRIPIFIVSKNKIQLDGSHPCLLFGYGGFNVSLTPSFSVSRIILLKHLDVVFCVANVRGGGEYGEGWHRAGSLGNKQNSFDDFISVGEYLVSNGYTRPNKLCIEGTSNGGLLVAACINQRPDLFGCALAHVGVMDMLRFHLFTIGHAWTSDFGCSDKEEEFHWLMKYSPLHNVRRPWEEPPYHHHRSKCQYPSTMLLTADHDDRVVPSHSLKLLATLQHVLCTSLEGRSPQTNPIIGRIECKAGHGCGRPTQKLIDEAADRYGFMAKALNASWID